MEKAWNSQSASLVDVDHFDTGWVPEPFSLEKPLNTVLDKYVPSDSTNNAPCLTICRKFDLDIERRELGVYFRNLRVTGLGATMPHQATVGSMLNPKAIWRRCRDAIRPSTKTLLHDFNGVVRPGEMLRKFIYRSQDPWRDPFMYNSSLSRVG